MPKFTDINVRFLPNPMTGDLVLVNDIAAINQSLRGLLLNSAYDKPFRSKSQFGDSINFYLFDMNDGAAITDIQENISRKIIQYEPRIILNSVTVVPDITNSRVGIQIQYQIRTTQQITSYSFFLTRA